MSADVFEVMRWERTGPNSGRGSNPIKCVGWPAASRLARKWLAGGPDCYVSIERVIAPFTAERARYLEYLSEPDWFCLTDFLSLDAPDYIAAGSVSFCCTDRGGPQAQSFTYRGRWI